MTGDDTPKVQSALSGWSDVDEEDDEPDVEPTVDTESTTSHSKDRNTGTVEIDEGRLYHEPSLDDDSCPWCLAPSTEFYEHNDESIVGEPGKVCCGNCGAAIPTDAEWYQNGKKIVY